MKIEEYFFHETEKLLIFRTVCTGMPFSGGKTEVLEARNVPWELAFTIIDRGNDLTSPPLASEIFSYSTSVFFSFE